MVDRKVDENEAEELKKVYKHYLENRKEIMKNTSFKVEDIFSDAISKDSVLPEKITKLKNFVAKLL